MSTDNAIEAEIQQKGLTSPRVTPQRIEEVIIDETYLNPAETIRLRGGELTTHHPFSLLTICVLTLKNGFTVTGESACASPQNFDSELGKKIARRNAVEKIWALEGYLLKQQLADGTHQATPFER